MYFSSTDKRSKLPVGGATAVEPVEYSCAVLLLVLELELQLRLTLGLDLGFISFEGLKSS